MGGAHASRRPAVAYALCSSAPRYASPVLLIIALLLALPLSARAAAGSVTAFPDLPALTGALLAAARPALPPPPPLAPPTPANSSSSNASANATASDVFLPPATLARSLLSVGADGALAAAAAALASRHCLTVVALGGSVTLGSSHNPTHPDRPAGPQDAYPARLKALLDSAFPCAGDRPGGHTVLNRGVYAVASDYWADKLAEALHSGPSCGAETPGQGNAEQAGPLDLNVGQNVLRLCAELAAAHLVLVDTSVNDAFDLVNVARANALAAGIAAGDGVGPDADARRSGTLTELVLALLLSDLPSSKGTSAARRGVVFVGTSSHGEAWRDAAARPRRTDMAAPQAAVCAAYGVPFVSAVDALGPFDTRGRAEWFTAAYRSDGCCHPSATGHAIIARLLLHAIALHAAPGACCGGAGAPAGPPPTPPRPPPQPLLASTAELDMYLRSRPLRVALTRAPPAAARGFATSEEAPGKPGLVGTAVGDAAAFALRLPLAAERARVGVMHVHLLRSHARLGLVRVDVAMLTPPGNTTCALPPLISPGAPPQQQPQEPAPKLLASRVLDGLWDTNATELGVEAIPIDAETLRAAAAAPGGGDATLCVTFAIEAAMPPREVNRVKLVALVLF